MFAVKDHTKSGNWQQTKRLVRCKEDMLRMEEEPNGAAKKKKNVFDVSTQRGHKQMEQISYCTWLSIILKKKKNDNNKVPTA